MMNNRLAFQSQNRGMIALSCSPRIHAMSVRCAATSSIKFAKYQGLGNDFILIDNRDFAEPLLTPEEAAKVCDRNFGVGGDGVIFALPPSNGSTDFQMRIYNSDGSEPEMCGNGIRCLARFVSDLANGDGSERDTMYKIDTLAGLIQPVMQSDGQVRVDMGVPILRGSDIPTTLPATEGREDGAVVAAPLEVDGKTYLVTCVSMGNPHAVVYSLADGTPISLDDIDLPKIGPLFENNEVFPARTNTEFVEVVNRSHVKMVVWERGAGQTLACGTGACALVIAGILEGYLDRNCRVDLPGGPLVIEWSEENGRVYMTGPAERVFDGELHRSSLTRA